MRQSILFFILLLMSGYHSAVSADMIITPIPPAGFEHTGDMNFDYIHTAEDAQYTFMSALGLWYLYLAGDCNGDDEITAGDSGGIFWSIFNESICTEPIPSPPAPFTPTPTPALIDNIIFSDSMGISCPGELFTFSIRVNNPDYELDCIGLELHFNPDIMSFHSYVFGDLFELWTMFDCQEYPPGIIRIAGFSHGYSIPSGSQGELIELTMNSNCQDCYWHELIPYGFSWLTDDLESFVSIPGELQIECVRDSHNGDTNLDHQVTSGDSQMAFMSVLGMLQLNFQQFTTADCNDDMELTAEDAQLIFETALGTEICVDPLNL